MLVLPSVRVVRKAAKDTADLMSTYQMSCLHSSRNAGAWGSTSVLDMLCTVVFSLTEDSFQSGLHKGPGTCIERLFLCPNDLLKIGVFLKLVTNMGPREGVELLDTSDSNIVDSAGGTLLHKGSINLARTEK